jgi:hypothetical protein
MKIYNNKNSYRVDKRNSKKLEHFDAREKVIFTGASLVGIALYGFMKSKGFDDLVSNYPMMGLYLGSYLESLYTFNKYSESDRRIKDTESVINQEQDTEVKKTL